MHVASFSRVLRTGEALLLRSPSGDEAGALLAYTRQLFHESSRHLSHPPSFFDAMTEDAERAFLEDFRAHPKNFFLAAYLDSRIVGTASITLERATYSAHCATIALAVLKSHWGKGIGRLLTQTLIDHASRAGVWNLMLRVRAFNTVAIALYESLGFERVGTLRAIADLPEGFADEFIYQCDTRLTSHPPRK